VFYVIEGNGMIPAGFTARLHVESRRNGPTELPSKVPYYKVQAGDRLTAYGPSGGG